MNSGSMGDIVTIPKSKLKELEKKAKAFDKIKAESEKHPFRTYSYKLLSEKGEDAEKIFKF